MAQTTRNEYGLTRVQHGLVIAAAIILFALLIVSIMADGNSPSPWVKRWDFGLAPAGVAQILAGWTMLKRADADNPNDLLSPNALRRFAFFLLILGAAQTLWGIYRHFTGA